MNVISQAIWPVSDWSVGEDFSWEMEEATLGPLATIRETIRPHSARRTRLDVDRSTERCCQLFVSLEAPWGYRHRGFSEMLEPGDAVLIGDGEHETSLPHGFNGIILKCPTGWVDTWLPDVTPLLGRRIAKNSRWGRVLSPMVRSLTPQLVADSPLTHAVLADQLGAMLTLIGGEAETHRDKALYGRISAALLERCTDLSLAAADIAAPLGMTPPELHRVLSSFDTTFLQLLNEARVYRAKALLRQPSLRDRSIAEIRPGGRLRGRGLFFTRVSSSYRAVTGCIQTPRRLKYAACCACMCALFIGAHTQADEGSGHLDEIVVTARKREEALQQVPMSVTALTATDLRGRSIERLSDLGQLTPNFFYGQQVQSGSSAGQLYIRGVGQHDTNSTFNSSVGLYVDGVYASRATADDLSLGAAQQVEVLYGPQGTLFGKNTNDGAVSITTAKPDVNATEWAATADLSAGSLRALHASADVQVPLIPQVSALELSVARHTDEGYGRRADGQREANQNRTSARAQLLVKPADDLEAILRLDGSRFNEHSGAYKLVAVRAASTIPQLYASATPYRYDDRWLTGGPLDTEGTGPNRNAGTVAGASFTLGWNRPWGTLKSISAYRRLSVESDFDPDGSPLGVLDVYNHVAQQQLSQELQAAGASLSGRFDWVLGAYYFHETIQDNQPANVAVEYFQGDANFDPQLHVINANSALYTQVNFAAWRQLKFTLGGRVGHDSAEVGRVQVDYPVPTVEQAYTRRSASWTSFLPRVGAQYQWTRDLMSYLSLSEGSKTGGFNGRAGSVAEFNRFSPEKVWTYEVGLRSEWLDRRLRFNATGYYSAYSDFQILLNSSVTDPASGNPVPFSFVGNIPRASIRGAELTLTTLPVAGLRLETAVGITAGRYERILPGSPVTRDSQFVDAPKIAISGSAEYAWPMRHQQQLTARVDYIHKSAIQFDYANSPLVEQRPFGLVNTRLTWLIPSPSLSLFAYGTNLTDVHYAIGGLDDGVGGSLGEVIKLLGRPREWGLGAQLHF